MRFGHVTRHDSPSKTLLQGALDGGRRRGRPKKCCMENIKDWTSLNMLELLIRASSGKDWKKCLLTRPSCPRLPYDPIGHGTEVSEVI